MTLGPLVRIACPHCDWIEQRWNDPAVSLIQACEELRAALRLHIAQAHASDGTTP